jgi:hypothetical protein
MKKPVDRLERIQRTIDGLPLRGRPQGRRTGRGRGKRSIPREWRDLDRECLEFALGELSDESLNDKSSDRQFVSCAARRAHTHERRLDYKIIKLGDKSTGPRRRRTHEQRVRRRARDVLMDAARDTLDEEARAALEPQDVT